MEFRLKMSGFSFIVKIIRAAGTVEDKTDITAVQTQKNDWSRFIVVYNSFKVSVWVGGSGGPVLTCRG